MGDGDLVLVVEEVPALQRLFDIVLADAGYEVAIAPDGFAALDLLAARTPALIVLDADLSGMSAFTFARELRRRGLRPGIPLLLVSAPTGDPRAFIGLGAEGALRKPFRLADFLDTVSRLARPGRAT
jgi:CheY-like chemotaxis protein